MKLYNNHTKVIYISEINAIQSLNLKKNKTLMIENSK